MQARWKKDPSSFVRLFFDQKTGRSVGAICKVLATERKIYRCVETPELEKIAGSHHHGGIVAIVTPGEERMPSAEAVASWVKRREPVLILDRIGNPHNLGALARTAAFFGIKNIVIPDSPEASRGNDAAYRVSEGGLEALELWVVGDLPHFLQRLVRAGYEVVGAATRDGKVLHPGDGSAFVNTGSAVPLHSSKSQQARPAASEVRGNVPAPVALVMGNEEHGMSPAITAACTRLVTLAGSGEVESLNVSVAGALLMWELLVARKK